MLEAQKTSGCFIHGGLVRRPACCWKIHPSFEFPAHYGSRQKGRFAVPNAAIQEGPSWFARRDTVIGRNWLTSVTHSEL